MVLPGSDTRPCLARSLHPQGSGRFSCTLLGRFLGRHKPGNAQILLARMCRSPGDFMFYMDTEAQGSPHALLGFLPPCILPASLPLSFHIVGAQGRKAPCSWEGAGMG
uniref:Uncharacterized protein n=1 Tax=Serinus canaria TaxID=9135 RepID=A0A8C9MJK3_SERCA